MIKKLSTSFAGSMLLTLFLYVYLSLITTESGFGGIRFFNTIIFFVITFIINSIFLFVFVKKPGLTEEKNKKAHEDEIKILKQNEKYRKEFLGNVSHELKTPLFNIQGYILTLLDGGLYDNDINVKYLERSEKNIERLIFIVRDLETISKLETGELKLICSDFDIKEMILETIDMLTLKASKINIDFKLTAIKEKYYVHADKEKIAQVITNLLSNSIKYGKINGTTEVRITENENKISIEIADNGIGIEEKYLTRIFERFFTVDKSRSKKLGGTGLGLSIVKHILDGHQEKITVESIPDKGTVFKFCLSKNEKTLNNSQKI